MQELPLWRSMLFVPVLTDKFVDNAARHNPDAVQLDLEDSIPPDSKKAARDSVRAAAAKIAGAGVDVLVRVNRRWRLALRDLEASVGEHVCAVTMPKVDSAEQVSVVAEVLDELEAEAGLAPGHTGIVVMLETASGLANAAAIARAPRVLGMTVGAEDLAVAMGGQPNEDLLYYANLQALTAARGAGVLPIGYIGSVADYADQQAFRARIERARVLGFEGGFCIHPHQVSILNASFTPSVDEVEQARRVVAAFDSALAEGRGATALDGRMLDLPIVDQARATLRRDELIRKKEAAAP